MAEVHNLLDDMARSCEELIEGHGACGSTKFNLLKSGKIECASCGDTEPTIMWFGTDQATGKVMAGIIGMMALTKDDFPTVLQTLAGLGLEVCKENGMDWEQHLIDITN